LKTALDTGAAAERFVRMVVELGGPADLLDRPANHLAGAPVVRPAPPTQTGTVQAMDVRRIGVAIVALGGGRRQVADRIDHRVGLTEVCALGEPVGPDRPLAVVHAADAAAADAAIAELQAAIVVGDAAVRPASVVRERLA
jgi:thymidine phosphorylase